MQPLNPLKYLRGHRDAIVIVSLASWSLFGILAGYTWVSLAILPVGGILHHIRQLGAERHAKDMARIGLEEKALNVEAIKARYRDLLTNGQPSLPLPPSRRTLKITRPEK